MMGLELEGRSGNVVKHVWEARALPLSYTRISSIFVPENNLGIILEYLIVVLVISINPLEIGKS